MATAEITDVKHNEGEKYPMLKRCNQKGSTFYECIMLFTNPTEGAIVWDPQTHNRLGYSCKSWLPEHFEPWKGTIELVE